MMSLCRQVLPKARGLTSLSCVRTKVTLPELPYDYAALEPIVCREIMEIHHSKHHQAYVTNYNAAKEQLDDAVAKQNTSKIISLEKALRFNGGGHLNHSIFWKNLSPDKSAPSDALHKAIIKDFKSMDNLKAELKTAAVGVQGSGWAWLGLNKKNNLLQVVQCANQDPLEATTGLIPLFGIDVWEHAYYLQYKNLRPTYVDAVFDIVNWVDVSERFSKA
nr:manganese superoxide dismutase [Diamesa zernyi]